MQQITELSEHLKQNFKWNKAKRDCLVGALLGMLKKESVNLNDIAIGFPSEAKIESRYRRLQRLIHDYIDFDAFAIFVMALFLFMDGDGYYLTLDRTNWKYGKQHINILMLAVVYKGIAIPVYWMLLNNKKGNSKTFERVALLKRFIKLFGKEKILGVLGDREFIGEDWIKWLQSENINFFLRLKKNFLVFNSRNSEKVHVEDLFRDLTVGEHKALPVSKKILNTTVYLTGLRLINGELLIIATDKHCENALEIYKKRWEIETLFGCLKTRGFNLEDTHLTKLSRIKRMLIIPALAFCWAYRTGEWYHENVCPIKIKKTLERPAKSIFKLGIEQLCEALINAKCIRHFFQFIEIKDVSLQT